MTFPIVSAASRFISAVAWGRRWGWILLSKWPGALKSFRIYVAYQGEGVQRCALDRGTGCSSPWWLSEFCSEHGGRKPDQTSLRFSAKGTDRDARMILVFCNQQICYLLGRMAVVHADFWVLGSLSANLPLILFTCLVTEIVRFLPEENFHLILLWIGRFTALGRVRQTRFRVISPTGGSIFCCFICFFCL